MKTPIAVVGVTEKGAHEVYARSVDQKLLRRDILHIAVSNVYMRQHSLKESGYLQIICG